MEASTIIFIHQYLAEFFSDKDDPISPPGVKDRTTVESAAARPFATAGGRDAYPTVFMKAASLLHSIICNHSFHNGNKRVALLSTLYFLSEYGYWVDRCDDEELYEFTRRIAAHEITENRIDEVSVISEWLENNSRKQQKGEKPLKLIALREILSRFEYELHEQGHTIEVCQNGTVVETVLKKGTKGAEDYDPAYIAELRKRLKLTAEDGVDSARFYGQKGIASELNKFMQLRLKVMSRLAKI